MTQETQSAAYPAVSSASKPNAGKRQISLEEIADTFQAVAEDIAEIGKLASEEKDAVTQFLAYLKAHMKPLTS